MENNFLKEKIIIPSWETIKNDANAKKFYFLPWILSIIFLTTILVYQSIYTYVVIFWKDSSVVLKYLLNILETRIWMDIFIGWGILLLLYFFIVPVFDAWLVKYIERRDKNEAISKSEAFWQWLYKFLPFFEYSNLFSPFKVLSIINAYLFVIRLIWVQYLKITTIAFWIILFFWLIINILFAYVKFFIILENKSVFQAIWESVTLTILNPKTTINLFFIVFILNFRVVFNFIVFLVFPILIGSAITYIWVKFLLYITVWIISIIFILLIFFIWYTTAVLEVFNTSIWYHAYLYGKENSSK